MTAARDRPSILPRLVPSWRRNLVFFGVLILFALAYFYWQVSQARQSFFDQVRRHALVLTEIVQNNAERMMAAQDTMNGIIETFLGNTARFVDYLNQVEPFSPTELAAFAQESGLVGIAVRQASGQWIEGPAGWMPDASDAGCESGKQSSHDWGNGRVFTLSRPKTGGGCIVVGIAANEIESLKAEIGLPRLLETLSGMAGISYLRVEAPPSSDSSSDGAPIVLLKDSEGHHIAQTRLLAGDKVLLLGLEADPLFLRTRQLWRQFILFGFALAILGVSFSILLHRLQQRHLSQVQSYERVLSKEKEDAALGRAAAAIAHEIRNPLNAIGMGLQRLLIEAKNLTEEERKLVATMRQAVARSNTVVQELRRYAQPLEPNRKALDPVESVKRIVDLYTPQCRAFSIEIEADMQFKGTIPADAVLLEEAIENLMKNSIEAQPAGGFIDVNVDRNASGDARLIIRNAGLRIGAAEIEKILEPYFTTKMQGTGLGMPLAARIVRAHGGSMKVSAHEPDILKVEIVLPKA